MGNFPIEILYDILVRLPLKSIARFRCVNNEWHNLLKNPEFLKTQYQHAVGMDNFSLILHGKSNVHTLSFDPLSSTFEGSGHDIFPVESLNWIQCFGCCNGLVLLSHIINSVLMLWNPCTNECKRVPNPPGASKDPDRLYVEYGLCYDSQIEDFKVVRLSGFLEEGWCEVLVYTVKSNSWRKLDYVEMDGFHESGIFDMGRLPLNGSLYWIADDDGSEFIGDRFILCFNIEKEEFDKMPLPDDNVYDGPILCVLGGSLCLFYFSLEVISVWELKDDGTKKSWAKLFTIEVEKHFGKDFRDFIPLQTLNNGKLLLGIDLGLFDSSRCDSSLHMVIYDPKQDTVLDIHEDSMACTQTVAVFVESLISLDTGTYLGPPQWEASHEADEDDPKEDKDEEEDADGDDVDGGTENVEGEEDIENEEKKSE